MAARCYRWPARNGSAEPADSAGQAVEGGSTPATWLCYIASHATEHAAELDPQTLQRMLALPGDGDASTKMIFMLLVVLFEW